MIPLVGVIMGSSSDWETMRHCAQTLELLAIPYEARVVSAHRTPDLLFEYVAGAEGRGLEVIIAGAGGAAHLPGMAAAKTLLPVLGVPVQSKALNGLDSLLSIVQMPAGVPVGTLAIGRAGAVNAALLAAAVLSGKHPRLREALAGLPLGFRFVFYDPAPNPCAAPLGEHVQGEFTDRLKLELFARSVDVVTFEFENIPLDCIEFLSARTVVRPGPEALAAARDRLHEKRLFGELGIPAPVVRDVDSLAGLTKAVREIGLPAVLKTRTLGYDGKGQYVLRALEDVAKAWQLLGGFSLVLESQVKFDREVSILAVRGANGETAFYPLSENVHQGGILRFSRSCPNDPGQDRAEELVGKLLRRLDYVGVLALELFQVGEEFLANEMAPRVHNSGHWTIEGAVTSQFENHLRAISGLPLGKTSVTGHSAMVNFIGGKPDLARLLALRGLHVHLYGKSERPGRKVGHATLWSRNKMSFAEGCKALRSML